MPNLRIHNSGPGSGENKDAEALKKQVEQAHNEELDLIDLLGEITDCLGDLIWIERKRAIREGAVGENEYRNE